MIMQLLGSLRVTNASASRVSAGGVGWEKDGAAAFAVVVRATLSVGQELRVESGGITGINADTYSGDLVSAKVQSSADATLFVQSVPIVHVSSDPYAMGWHITTTEQADEIKAWVYLVAGFAKEIP